uniref:PH domain-containing protein n=1 Tax=Romanomermis culicivorax TaxID=13658 RepID=A0A915LDQ4_ROMCU
MDGGYGSGGYSNNGNTKRPSTTASVVDKKRKYPVGLQMKNGFNLTAFVYNRSLANKNHSGNSNISKDEDFFDFRIMVFKCDQNIAKDWLQAIHLHFEYYYCRHKSGEEMKTCNQNSKIKQAYRNFVKLNKNSQIGLHYVEKYGDCSFKS